MAQTEGTLHASSCWCRHPLPGAPRWAEWRVCAGPRCLGPACGCCGCIWTGRTSRFELCCLSDTGAAERGGLVQIYWPPSPETRAPRGQVNNSILTHHTVRHLQMSTVNMAEAFIYISVRKITQPALVTSLYMFELAMAVTSDVTFLVSEHTHTHTTLTLTLIKTGSSKWWDNVTLCPGISVPGTAAFMLKFSTPALLRDSSIFCRLSSAAGWSCCSAASCRSSASLRHKYHKLSTNNPFLKNHWNQFECEVSCSCTWKAIYW